MGPEGRKTGVAGSDPEVRLGDFPVVPLPWGSPRPEGADQWTVKQTQHTQVNSRPIRSILIFELVANILKSRIWGFSLKCIKK